MFSFMIRWLLFALALIFIAWIVPGIEISGIIAALIAVVIIGLINAVVRPIALFFAFPINLVTLGLFTFVINALMLMLSAYFAPGFNVSGFVSALIGSLFLSLLALIIDKATKEKASYG